MLESNFNYKDIEEEFGIDKYNISKIKSKQQEIK